MTTLESEGQNVESISLFKLVRMEGYIDRYIKTFQDQIKILRQLITEIKKFHDEDRVIGNLGPFNIYVNIVDKQFAIRPDIKLDSGWSHYWTQNTKDTDIFLLGCVFYFILSRGKHPFGYVSQCQLMEKNLFYLGSCKNIHIRTLIQRMIHFDPQKRPTITDVCNHLMFREPNLIASFLGEYANEDPQLIDEYCPVKYSDFLSTASHRFDGSKLERKAETVSIRPGRLKDFYVDVIVATEVEDEQLIRYYTSLFKLSANSSFVLCPSYELRDNIVRLFPVEPIELTLRAAVSDSRIPDLDSSKSVFRQIVAGLDYLHGIEIVHGTLSPDEVVIEFKSDRIIVVKIAKLTRGQDDWSLPTASKQDDVRRLGCILYWLLSRGESHPFGTSERRLENLHQNKYELKNISAESYHLIWLMIDQTVPCCAIFRHPFFWTDETITAFFQAGYYVISTGSYGIETFPISPTDVQDSDLGRWFKEHGGIPRDSHSVLQSFVSWLNELEERGEEFLFETYQRWGRSMKDIFPDFPLQLWAVFVKNIVDERDELDHWYIPTCEVNVDQILQSIPKGTETIGKKRNLETE